MQAETERLLQGTPTGVYQLGNLVSGPLGIIESAAYRWAPPSLSLPLWHCSDTGCSALHDVDLVNREAPVEAFLRIDNVLSERFGPPSEWRFALRYQNRPAPPCLYIDLLAFIADCIIGPELTALMEAALLGTRRDTLRSILALPPRGKRAGEGPAIEVASRLNPGSQLQLLLSLSDQELVDLIDDVVISGKVRVPLGEVRELPYRTSRNVQDSGSALSALGIRSVRELPTVSLTSAIWRAYQRSGDVKELAWRVRDDPAKSPYEALVAFIRKRGPAEAVRGLILSSAGVTEAVCEDLHIPRKYAKGADDNAAVDRLLWKLGFDPMQFGDSIPRFKVRLSELNQSVLSNSPIDTEDARERIRAAGVNVFVSLEDFLDRLISYNVWLLSSDHFLATHFMYSSGDGRRSVAQTLGKHLDSGGTAVSWDVRGENPLGTLLRYLRGAADWIQALPESDRNNLQRPERDLPHFADNKDRPFPFRHLAMWADSDVSELRLYAEQFGRIVKLIEESDPAGVRNGLDHFREVGGFPTADKLLASVVRLGQALELADLHRFVPKVFWLFSETANRFGAAEVQFYDYSGHPTILYGPDLVSGLPRVSRGAWLLAPGNLLGTPNAPLTFQLREPSEFSLYWRNFPRRRRIVARDHAQAPPNPASPAPSIREA